MEGFAVGGQQFSYAPAGGLHAPMTTPYGVEKRANPARPETTNQTAFDGGRHASYSPSRTMLRHLDSLYSLTSRTRLPLIGPQGRCAARAGQRGDPCDVLRLTPGCGQFDLIGGAIEEGTAPLGPVGGESGSAYEYDCGCDGPCKRAAFDHVAFSWMLRHCIRSSSDTYNTRKCARSLPFRETLAHIERLGSNVLTCDSPRADTGKLGSAEQDEMEIAMVIRESSTREQIWEPMRITLVASPSTTTGSS